MLNIYRTNKSDANRVNMVTERSQYKTCLRKCSYEYDKNKTTELTNARYKNAKMYWNMLKGCANVKPSTMPLTDFEMYFKAVNNPETHFFTHDEDVLYFIERYERNELTSMFDELNVSITTDEILKGISNLKN